MNVAFDPWIPTVTTSGKRKLVSLCEVFTDGKDIADLAVRPHERVALMRLFLCVAHAALDGPKDYDEWCDVPKRLPEAAGNYLTEKKESFELFHKTKPWLQVADLKPMPSKKCIDSGVSDLTNWSPLNRLCFTRASGFTPTLFDHKSNSSVPTQYSEEEIALNLLTFQNFFVAGGKASSRRWGDVVMKNPPNPKGGPCSGKSILFTFLKDKSLFQSIYMNLNTHDDLRLFYGDSEDWLGKPIWEIPIKSPDDKEAITNATLTHIGRLVPQTRILLVNHDCRMVLLGAGFFYPKFQDEKNTFSPDLFATIVNRNGTRELLSASPKIDVWRQLHALVVRSKSASSMNRGPSCLMNIPDADSCDIIVNALMTNPNRAAEKIDLIESVFHIPSQLRSSEGTVSYESEVSNAESIANKLGWAVETYRHEIDHGWEGKLKSAGPSKWKLKARLHSNATTHYWTSIEIELPLLMTHIEAIGTGAAIPTQKIWRRMLFASACEAYRIACGQETPRQMKAFAKGWQILTGKKEESKSQTDEGNTEVNV